MDSKQFAWMYLIENGMAGRTPSFYGGYDFTDDVLKKFKNLNKYDYKKDSVKDAYLKDLKIIGVNWEKTLAPKSDSISKFNGTFAESSEYEVLIGTIVLNDGSKQQWVADKL